MNNKYQYRVASCPICKQGYLEIVKEQETGKLFICYDEISNINWQKYLLP